MDISRLSQSKHRLSRPAWTWPVLLLFLAGCDLLQRPVEEPADLSASEAVDATPPPIAESPGTPTPSTDRIVAFQGQVDAAGTSSAPTDCRLQGFPRAGKFSVFATGAYAGRKLGWQIDQSGHEATRIDVAVNHAAEPVVLMLGAYEPTVWNIGWTKDTRIVGVLVSGYHRQVVAGLPKDVPMINSSHDNRGPCGYFYVTQDKVASLNPVSQRVFGKPVDLVYLANNGSATIGNPVLASQLRTSSRITPDSFRDPDAPLAGAEGLADAVRRGLLRPAGAEDMQAWQQAHDKASNAGQPRIANPSPSRGSGVHNGYTVLQPMRLPAGLYGAHSATFFVPKGVQRPAGDPGHSAIYDFNNMTCQGAMCRMTE